MFAHDFNNSSTTTVHYDRAVLDIGGGCTGTGCTSCQDCGNQACVNGACGSCTDSSQCCAPIVCEGGTCVDVVIL